MKLAYPLLDRPIEFAEDTVNVLVLENAVELRKAVRSLKRQTDGEPGEFVLSEEHEPKDFSKLAALVTDPFSLELSSKKISTKLTQEASRTARELDDDLRRIMSDINSLAAKISAPMEFETIFTELEGADALIKMLDFCIDEAELSFPEAILEYMKLQRVFFNKRLFVFYNLKACLSETELSLLYRSACYEKYAVLLVEDRQRSALPEEKTVVVDNDLCVF